MVTIRSMEYGMKDLEPLITSYGAHSFTYTMGRTVHDILGELAGKKTSVVIGKGGSIHMYVMNFYGGMGIVRAQVPLGAGIWFRVQVQGQRGSHLLSVGGLSSKPGPDI